MQSGFSHGGNPRDVSGGIYDPWWRMSRFSPIFCATTGG
ncbi:hypothetical protein Lokhon_00657 [Limimaricola hongkongensis DSM 17492]|uniref:Uncharacterized protein n=1 Tax=Limimaricola hongkongensis DSM 17492 TaxID=1122180 RepID=A0A017HFJ5_9RHOB|nr:hypothetical protein Lokhon_00657 [Limimaricola hongkongensis DSM 17492]